MNGLNITDFHAHILPGADHGSKNIETTKAQLSLMKDAGVDAVVATPHFYPQNDSVESFLERRKASAEALLSIEAESRPQVYLGAEVLVCPGIDHMPGIERLCIEGTGIMLLEMPFSSWSDGHIASVARLARKGFTVIMAHIDRYPEKDVARLVNECDVYYQINGETQSTLKGKMKAGKIMDKLPVAAVGSDIHGTDKTYVKNFLRLYEKCEKAGFDLSSYAKELLEGAKTI
ncbi:MAG: hypothetical protein E7647_03885 [Ruminococcaceae bacterium]|nr:hypothetical protein [Oscillospiraceae bacterium]